MSILPVQITEILTTAIKGVQDRVDYFEQNYQPNNLSVPGTVNLGTDASDEMNVNSTATFTSDANFEKDVTIHKSDGSSMVTTDNLTVTNDTVIGQDSSDTLVVNAQTTFPNISSNNLTVSCPLVATNDVTLASNVTSVTCNGDITAPNYIVAPTSGNSIQVGGENVIKYVVYNANGNIFTDCPDSAIVVVKYTGGGTSNNQITYNNSGGVISATSNQTLIFLKTSTSGFVRIL